MGKILSLSNFVNSDFFSASQFIVVDVEKYETMGREPTLILSSLFLQEAHIYGGGGMFCHLVRPIHRSQ